MLLVLHGVLLASTTATLYLLLNSHDEPCAAAAGIGSLLLIYGCNQGHPASRRQLAGARTRRGPGAGAPGAPMNSSSSSSAPGDLVLLEGRGRGEFLLVKLLHVWTETTTLGWAAAGPPSPGTSKDERSSCTCNRLLLSPSADEPTTPPPGHA